MSPRDCRAAPGRLPRVPWAPAPYPPAPRQGFDSQPAAFSSSIRESRRAGQAGSTRQRLLARPCPPRSRPRGKTHPAEGRAVPVGCSVLSLAFPSPMGFGGQERDAALPHCGTTRGSSRDVPDPRLQPCLSGSSAPGGGEGGRRHGAGGAFPHPTFAKRPDDLVEPFFAFFPDWSGRSPRGAREMRVQQPAGSARQRGGAWCQLGGCGASGGVLPCFPATNHRLDGRRTGQKGWRNLAGGESLPHKGEALIKPSWGREVCECFLPMDAPQIRRFLGAQLGQGKVLAGAASFGSLGFCLVLYFFLT